MGAKLPNMTGDDVRRVKFREKLRGYNPEDVDAFLDRVANELDQQRSPRPLLDGLSFREKLRGYHPDDVDKFVDRLRTL
jgi:DivIVA domain-containing protein